MEGQFTLQELNSLVRENLALAFPEQIWVMAEIGELKVNRNGHCYIELVEKNKATDTIVARSRATIWAWQFRFIQPYFETITGQALTAGLNVLVSATIEFHEVYGLSLNIKDIDPAYTLGDMARKRREVLERLDEEGIIDMNRDLDFPEIPSRIAIISSATAAGYEDFMNQLHGNKPSFKFYTKLFQATMQGNNAPESINYALDMVYAYEDLFDVVIIIRGGGSQMDLSCFDNYELAAHIAQFPKPVLTGIGHEKDESVADLVAFQKLKTPTAVADFLIDKMEEAALYITQLEDQFFYEAQSLIDREKQRLSDASRLFKPLIKSNIERNVFTLKTLSNRVKPLVGETIEQQRYVLSKKKEQLKTGAAAFLKDKAGNLHKLTATTVFTGKMATRQTSQFLDEKKQELIYLSRRRLEKESSNIEWLDKNKQLIDPANILKRGFSITLKNGKAVKNASELNEGEIIVTKLLKGSVRSEVKK
ncbi:MAG: exodeoxyribonuclease VII large subunit [Prolixibacteraceae bacterium]|nr:exodeoxyribonuclease VII large subunit [Prolixibacteraceae bacterium]